MNLQGREKLAQTLLNLRGSKSRRAFARELGVTATAVIGWENTASVPDRENLTKIAIMAGYSLDDFIAYLEGEPPIAKPTELERMVNNIKNLPLQQLALVERAVSDRLVAIAEASGGR